MRRLIVSALALLAVLAGCGSSAGTFVLVHFKSDAPLPDLRTIHLDIQLGSQHTTLDVHKADGSVMVLPLTKSLQIGSGSGLLTIAASARDGGGGELASATGSVTVTRDQTAQVDVSFGGAGDGGVDSGSDAASDGSLLDAAASDGGPDANPGSSRLISDVSSYDFGTVQVAQTVTHTFTISNLGNGASGPLSASFAGPGATAYTADASMCAAGIAPGGGCTLAVSFTPSAPAVADATLSLGTVSILLSGTGVPAGSLTITQSLPFSSVIVGQTSAAMGFTVQNQGTSTTGRLTALLGGTDSAQFTIMNDQCSSLVLAPSGMCTVAVSFAPTTPGSKTASLAVNASPGGTAVSSLTGLATSALTLMPSTQNFGTALIGSQSAPFTFMVMNSSATTTSPLSLTIGGPDPGEFKLLAPGAGDCASAMMLGAGQTCTLKVAFAPSSGGAKAGILTVAASIGGSVGATLSGFGVRPALLSVAPLSASFPTTAVAASSASASIVVMNTGELATGPLTLTLGGANSGDFMIGTPTDCSAGMTLAAGAQCTVSVVFHPTAKGARAGTLAIAAAPGGSQVVTLTGTAQNPAQLTSAMSALNFGSVMLGQTSSAMTFTVSNPGDVATGTITSTVTGQTADYSITANTCMSVVLAPAGTCSITLAFAPQTGGTRTIMIALAATPGGNLALTATGGGAQSPAAFTLTPPSLSFPATLLGADSAPLLLTVTNTGQLASAAMSFEQAGSNAADFAEVPTPGDCMAGATLAGGASCTLHVAFSPSARGLRNATLTVAGAPSAPASLPLSGTGQAPAALAGLPPTLDFPGTALGQISAPLTFVVTNSGDVASAALTTAGSTADFHITTNTCMGTLAGGASCNVVVVFQPASGGTLTTTITVSAMGAGSASTVASGLAGTPITLMAAGSGQGTISTAGANLNCASVPCTQTDQVASGTMVSITALPGPSLQGNYFSGWSGACTGTNRVCVLTVASTPLNVTAHFEVANVAFVTNSSFPGFIGGMTPDQLCQQRATAAGMTGTFLAFVTMGGAAPHARFPAAARGWIRPDGVPLGDLLGDLMFTLQNPLQVSENQATVSGTAWTGLNSAGDPGGMDCSNWTNGGGAKGITGAIGSLGSGWMSTGTQTPCFAGNHFYCFGVSQSQPLVFLP